MIQMCYIMKVKCWWELWRPTEREDCLKDSLDCSAFNLRGREFHDFASQKERLRDRQSDSQKETVRETETDTDRDSIPQNIAIFWLIHRVKLLTRANTETKLVLQNASPQLTIPRTTYLPDSSQTNGPPLSPWLDLWEVNRKNTDVLFTFGLHDWIFFNCKVHFNKVWTVMRRSELYFTVLLKGQYHLF